ncbi:hypothetical protein AAEH84_17895, partial [Shewanella indica]|uniref:hypothetical protein n=1 Tax=Shewanella indica TaxID=768528 RepID=UPI00313CC122
HVFRVAAVPCQWERIIGSLNFCARAKSKKNRINLSFAHKSSQAAKKAILFDEKRGSRPFLSI